MKNIESVINAIEMYQHVSKKDGFFVSFGGYQNFLAYYQGRYYVHNDLYDTYVLLPDCDIFDAITEKTKKDI